MKKKNILNLIKYYTENNDQAFRDEAYEIASDFNRNGDYEIGEYILALLSNKNYFTPQSVSNNLASDFFRLIPESNESFNIPAEIGDNLTGIINAISYNQGINKFLFQGKPGSGKTESAKQLARILNRKLYSVDFNALIDSKLGQTSKNISSLFTEMNNLPFPEQTLFLFDEIDALALDRTDSRDLREMGRAVSTLLKEFDNMNSALVIIATTNLFENFDKALIRRFDNVVNFNCYSNSDLVTIAEDLLNETLKRFKIEGRNKRLANKIFSLPEQLPYPGDLKNIIRTSVAFSSKAEPYDYFRRLFNTLVKNTDECKLEDFKEYGFSLREIEVLTKVSKSNIARLLKEDKDE